VVNADVQTTIEPASSSFPDPSILAVHVGTSAPFVELTGTNSAAIAAYDTTVGGAIGLYATSSAGTAISARSASNAAVLAVTGNSIAIYGIGDGGGVAGEGFSLAGVYGSSQSADGVFGVGGVGAAGVHGSASNGYGGHFEGSVAPLLLTPRVIVGGGAPPNGTHLAGEFVPDIFGVLWFCIADGTPGTWVRLAGVRSGVPGGALNYLSTPIRIYDTRGGTPAPLPASKGALSGNSTHTVQVTGTDVGGVHVPSGATGVFGNLTVTNTQGPGDLILWPHGATQPNSSNINYGSGQTVANAVNVGLSAGGAMDLFVHVSGTDVIIDIAGYVL
jgi:hypothetical protein